jgi:hypothetical protein
MRSALSRWFDFAQQLVQALFDLQVERKFPWLKWFWFAALYLLGAFLWGKFLNWGNIPFSYHDWAEVTAARVAFVRDALLKGELPLHMANSAHLRNITDRYMVIPDVILAPQMMALYFLGTGKFIFANLIFLYTLGAGGLLWFRRRLGLSLMVSAIVFAVFNFNGHIVSHLSVGHLTWWGYFLFPWVLVLIFRLYDGRQGWRWITWMALLLFFMYLQGAFHQFVWALLLLGLLALARPKDARLLFKTIFFSLLLSAFRLLPPALALGLFDSEYLGGYPSTAGVLDAMVTLKTPLLAQPVTLIPNEQALGWWEYDLYVGLIGAAFLLYFGLHQWLKNRKYPDLILPTIVLFVLSIGQVYQFLRLTHIPLFSGERVSSRMIIIPVLVVLLLAAENLQNWLANHAHPCTSRLIMSGLAVLLINDLWAHTRAWQVTAAAQVFRYSEIDLATKVVANHPDPLYLTIIVVGGAISLLSAAFLFYQSRREKAAQPGS